LATSRPVRIARPRTTPVTAGEETGGAAHAVRPAVRVEMPGVARRANRGGTQRAFRVTAVYLVALVAIFGGFVLYDRTTPGGTTSPESNGLLTFTVIFLLFAVFGLVFSLTPAPRSVEVSEDQTTIIGRWGRRRRLPSLEKLSLRVVRKYPEGWLSPVPVELVELWGEGIPVRSYLVEADLFHGVPPTGIGPGR